MNAVTNNNSLAQNLLDNEQPSSATSLASKTSNVVLDVVEQPAAQIPAVAAQPKKSCCKKVTDNLDKIVFGLFVASLAGLTQGFGLGNLF